MNALVEAPAGTITALLQYPAPSSNRILLVDDDLSIRQEMSQVLHRSGYDVDTAKDGEAGWKAFEANSYDLLIMDSEMSRTLGLELVKKLRSAQRELPVILVSGTLDLEELNQIRSLNISALLSKPFTSDQLLRTVKQALHVTVDVRTASESCVALWVRACSHAQPTSHWGINE